MKLTYFTDQTLPKQMGGKSIAKISFGKSGTISVNAPACELMGIKAGEKISLSRDEDAPENWYLFKDKNHGFEVRGGYDEKGCVFNHRKLVETFLEAVGKPTNETIGFLIAGQPTTLKGDKSGTQYWGILVR
jgi:hypothetical protein